MLCIYNLKSLLIAHLWCPKYFPVCFLLGKLYTCSFFLLGVYCSNCCILFICWLSWSMDLMQSSHSWFLCSKWHWWSFLFLEILFRILLVHWFVLFDPYSFLLVLQVCLPFDFPVKSLVFTLCTVAVLFSPMPSAVICIQISPTSLYLGLSSLRRTPTPPIICSGCLHLAVLPATDT